MPIKISPSRGKRNNSLVLGIVFIFLGIFLTFQLKSAKLLFISLIGVLGLILWWQKRKKYGPVTAKQRIVNAISSIGRVNIILVAMFIFLFSISMVSATQNITFSVDGIHTSGSIVGGDFVLEQVDLENAEVNVGGQTYLTNSLGMTEAIIFEAGTYTFTISKEGYETHTLDYEINANIQHYVGVNLNVLEEECFEDWSCMEWGECSNNEQHRTCTDLNNCNNVIKNNQKPDEGRNCNSNQEICTENWQCGSWSECINNQQTKTCTDQNSCGTTINKPLIQQSCTIQDDEDDEESEDDEDDEKIETELEVEYEEENGETKIKVKLSNGREAEIKIMPETASKTAIDRLGELEFEIELKEVGKEGETKIVYEAKAKKQGKFLGLFKIKGEVQTQIDADTGEIISIKKPWWSFLASGI